MGSRIEGVLSCARYLQGGKCMRATERPGPDGHDERDAGQSDRSSRLLVYAIFLLIITMLSIILYGFLAGMLDPPAPRTRTEAVAAEMEAKTKAQPGNGKAWADYAEALYASGDKSGARDVLTRGRLSVTNKTIIELDNAELHLLLLDGNSAEVLKRSTAYVQTAIDLRAVEAATNKQKGIVVSYDRLDNDSLITLFTLRATAEANLGNFKDAIVDFDNALKLDPQAADLITLKGWAKLRSGRKADAAKDFKQALQFLPGDLSATNGLKATESTETSATK
jgi:tetratricopeptide (TPR) repeat protein